MHPFLSENMRVLLNVFSPLFLATKAQCSSIVLWQSLACLALCLCSIKPMLIFPTIISANTVVGVIQISFSLDFLHLFSLLVFSSGVY